MMDLIRFAACNPVWCSEAQLPVLSNASLAFVKELVILGPLGSEVGFKQTNMDIEGLIHDS